MEEKEMTNESNKKIVLIIGLILFVVIIIVFCLLFFKEKYNANNEDINSNSIIDIQKYVNIENTLDDLTTYNIDLYNAVTDLGKIDDLLNLGKYNISLKYKIKDYNIILKLTNGIYDDVIAFNLYVNDTLIGNDGYTRRISPYLTMYLLGDNIINETHFHTDVASSFDIINKENDTIKSNTIHELDKTKGMIFENISVSSDGVSVIGTRVYHCSINYEQPYTIYDGSEYSEKVKSLSNDIIVEAKYLYKYENGKINNEPKISGQVTLKDFLDSNSGKTIYNSTVACK